MNKKVISSEEFIDMFVECLGKGKEFRLEDCIVEGDVNILDIYERIKDNEKLKELITEEKFKESGVIDKSKMVINVNINITFHNVEFNGNFQMFKKWKM